MDYPWIIHKYLWIILTYQQISQSCNFRFELLTKLKKKWLDGSLSCSGACLFRLHDFAIFAGFCFEEENNITFLRDKAPEATAKTTQSAFHVFVGRGGPIIAYYRLTVFVYLLTFFQHLLLVGGARATWGSSGVNQRSCLSRFHKYL